jgi:hypothetical protein
VPKIEPVVEQPEIINPPVSLEPMKVTELRGEQIDATRYAGLNGPQYVIRSESEWSKIWAARKNQEACEFFVGPDMCGKSFTPQMPSDIDFKKYTLIGIVGELSPSESVEIVKVTREGDAIKVQTHRSNTYCGCGFAQIQREFRKFFLIPATSLPVQFQESKDQFIDVNKIDLGQRFTENQKSTVTFALRNEGDWRATWSAYQLPGNSNLAPPLINFNTQMVLGLSLPKSSAPCHESYITSVVEDPWKVQVLYGIKRPLDQEQCLANKARQTVFVIAPKFDKPIWFVNMSYL